MPADGVGTFSSAKGKEAVAKRGREDASKRAATAVIPLGARTSDFHHQETAQKTNRTAGPDHTVPLGTTGRKKEVGQCALVLVVVGPCAVWHQKGVTPDTGKFHVAEDVRGTVSGWIATRGPTDESE